jgi:hypothetical protein
MQSTLRRVTVGGGNKHRLTSALFASILGPSCRANGAPEGGRAGHMSEFRSLPFRDHGAKGATVMQFMEFFVLRTEHGQRLAICSRVGLMGLNPMETSVYVR